MPRVWYIIGEGVSGMKIYVWGTGCGVDAVIGKAVGLEDVAAFVDGAPGSAEFMGKRVLSPEDPELREAELILVASRHAEEIAARCRECGIDAARLLFIYDHYVLTDRNESYEAARRALDPGFLAALRSGARIIPTLPDDASLPARDLEDDYVRLRTLQLAARETERAGLDGAAAELGVYRGAFAACINRVFPGRRLYLFDSFEGFDPDEAAADKNGCGEAFLRAHERTGESRVLARMPHPEQVTIKKGLFPASLGGLEEKFAFVSLDVDLESSTFAGLEYFYPRLQRGGYLFVHDYNSPTLPGVRAAVGRYERSSGCALAKTPLCDRNGTLVITK